MLNRSSTILLLIIAFGLGWLGRGWWQGEDVTNLVLNSKSSSYAETTSKKVNDNQKKDFDADYVTIVRRSSSEKSDEISDQLDKKLSEIEELIAVRSFKQLLDSHLYVEATTLYRLEGEKGSSELVELKAILLKQLSQLLTARDYTRFSELTDAFLSAYYDDIDVLLLLADFNQSSGFFIEAVNVYQLIKTYAYTTERQQLWFSRFDQFVNEVDQYYSNQADWFSLSGLYSHIEVLGLLSAAYQYRQAIAYLNGGDEFTAIERLKPLVNDSEIGAHALATLNSLTDQNIATIRSQDSRFQSAKNVALQQVGNQYLVDLRINRRDDVTLLIDTGASMTTLSRSAFSSLSSGRKLDVVGTRVFQTANGLTKGTVYRVDQLRLGPFQLNNTHIAVLDFTLSPGVDGLLGMNVLGQFRFQIDQDNKSLLLSQK